MPKSRKTASKIRRTKKIVKGWCAKFALTRGVFPVDVELVRPAAEEGEWWNSKRHACYATIQSNPHDPVEFLDEGVDFFKTKKEAVERAKWLASRAIEALHVRVAKLATLRDNVRILPRDPRRSHWRNA